MTDAAPIQSQEDMRANATFDALMWAFSRPGQVKTLPQPGEAPLVDALIDRECRVFSADPLLMPQILRAGAQIAEAFQADHLFLGALKDADLLRSIRLGSDLYPDDGATLVLRATFGAGANLQLSGPGVDGTLTIQISGLPDEFWNTRKQVMRYPTGFELILLDGDQVIALPRSTIVEVL